jgi:cysteinyl-tRNA synthetase
MPISIYNSLTRKKEQFQPLNPQEIKMYVCGPTVYDLPHIGHARSAYIFDVIRRYLVYRGYKVKFVRNVTDVDDKIIEKARAEFKGEDLNTGVKKVADKYLSLYHQALADLVIGTEAQGILEPKASEYIGKMIDFIKRLIDKGIAYVAGEDVYFDITQARNYGKLSNQSLAKMEAGSRVGPAENKKNPLDFALWKSAKENEPSWDSPWGKGRPGWHIECSVMSLGILGEEFDIHGGGIDLIFPHHENEIAQSEGAGCRFARYWIHHGLLTINGQKMAKSLGNFITVDDFMQKYQNADLLKLFFLSTHYSHPIDYTEDKIEESKKQRNSFDDFFDRANTWGILRKEIRAPFSDKDKTRIDNICLKFYKSMDDDFNTPRALASLFELINLGFIFIAQDKEEAFLYIKSKLEILFDLLSLKIPPKPPLSSDIIAKINEMDIARKNKDFKRADELREILKAAKFNASTTRSNISISIIREEDKK